MKTILLAVSLTCFIIAPFWSATAEDQWPTVNDLYVGDVFKYPLLKVGVTQPAAGFRAVDFKTRQMKKLDDEELKDLLKDDPIPVVASPDGHFYQIDHHHQALAALHSGRNNAFYVLTNDFSRLGTMNEFWKRMASKHYVRAVDERGRPIAIPEGLPKSITGLKDDPYRSLAWFVRKSGGYRKAGVEFAEFQWADFFRTRIELGKTDDAFSAAVAESEKLAHTDDAKGLPGWVKKRISAEERD